MVITTLQAEAAKAAELKGPHTFSLPRLLQVYASLLRADENHGSISSSSSGHQQDRLAAAGGWLGVQKADVMMGVNSLVAARLMSKVSKIWPLLMVFVQSGSFVSNTYACSLLLGLQRISSLLGCAGFPNACNDSTNEAYC